jgi:type IX secretion system PorP/SprF family membrane protein
MLKSRIIFFLLIICTQIAFSQDANLSQFFNFSPSINPAFCGANNYSRVNFGARNQWIALNSGYNSSYIGFDHYLKPYYSGLGGFIKYDRTPSGFTNIQIQTQLSHIIQVGMKSAMRFGAQIGLVNNQFNMNSLLFSDQLSNDGNQNDFSKEINNNLGESKLYFDLGLGMLYYSEKYWIGASGYHLNKPNIGFGKNESLLPISWSVHTGARFYVGREKGIQREVRKTFSPALLLRNSANLFQFDFTGIYNLQPILVGFGYRGLPILRYEKLQNDAVILLAGYRTKDLFFCYSYDLPVSSLGISTLGSHEISIVVEFGDRAGGSKRGARIINTPFPLLYSN